MYIFLYILNGYALSDTFVQLCVLVFVLREVINVFTFYDYLDLMLSLLYLSGGVCCLSVLHPTHPPAHLPVCCKHFTTASP